MIAMSGGVDSSVAAALTAEARGADSCAGVAMRLYSIPDEAVRTGRTCCATEDLYDARRAAATVGIRFYVYDAQERFRAQVIDPFVDAYADGETPNPCVRCNDHVKFDWLLDRARRLGAAELVTGHYARIRFENGRHRLLRARDSSKDQSYFLHGLTQEELALVRFPLGDLSKTQVREIARERGLPNADKPESMEVCFVGTEKLADFLEAHGVAKARGEIVDVEGRVLGEHAGVHRFTVGQRKGLSVSRHDVGSSRRPEGEGRRHDVGSSRRPEGEGRRHDVGSSRRPEGEARRHDVGSSRRPEGEGRRPLPLYVAALDAGRQRVVVGTREQASRRAFSIAAPSWVSEPPRAELRCEVQVRHRGKPLACTVAGGSVTLDEPAIGVAPGQSAVFYRGDEVLGGATISRA
jgi:tRNA-specific 2-thiouridylase